MLEMKIRVGIELADESAEIGLDGFESFGGVRGEQSVIETEDGLIGFETELGVSFKAGAAL